MRCLKRLIGIPPWSRNVKTLALNLSTLDLKRRFLDLFPIAIVRNFEGTTCEVRVMLAFFKLNLKVKKGVNLYYVKFQ